MTVRLAAARRADRPRLRQRHAAADARHPRRSGWHSSNDHERHAGARHDRRSEAAAGVGRSRHSWSTSITSSRSRRRCCGSMREALKPGGRLVLLEYRKEDPTIPIKPEHKMSVAEAKMEVEAEGFTLAKVDEALPRQHILIFTKCKSVAVPSPSPSEPVAVHRTDLPLPVSADPAGAVFRHAARASTAPTATGCCWSPASSSTPRAAARSPG